MLQVLTDLLSSSIYTFILFITEFIGVTFINKIILDSGVQFSNTLPVCCIVCSWLLLSLFIPLYHLLPPPTLFILRDSAKLLLKGD